MSAAWTATYMRYGTQYEAEFDSLSAAVGFAKWRARLTDTG